jgi:D-alanine-D-alanine ligase
MKDNTSLQTSGCRSSRLAGPSTSAEVPPADIAVTGAAGLIGLVSGGRSGERDRSLLSAEAVGEALRRQNLRYALLDPSDSEFADRIRAVDVAFLAIAGQWAEDGKLQGLLDSLGVPYTGSGVLASALAMHKPTAKEVVSAAGVNVLPHIPVPSDGDPEVTAKVCSMSLGMPVILKPCSEGGSIGMRVLRDTGALAGALAASTWGKQWFIEPFVAGDAVTCGVLDRDGQLTTLPPLETFPTTAEFYDYAAKRNPAGHRYRCPAGIPEVALEEIARSALGAHRALHCSGFSRSDFLVTRDGEVFWLEANTLPGLSAHGNMATMASAAGISYDELIQAILATADRDGYRP